MIVNRCDATQIERQASDLELHSIPGRPRRIAVLRALQLGDLLHAVPALRALRKRFLDAEITLIGLPWARSFVERYAAFVDQFMEFPGHPGIPECEYCPDRAARFLDQVHAMKFDIAIQMHGSGKHSNAFVTALGSRCTVGFHDPTGGERLDVSDDYPDHLPESDRNLRLVEMFGCEGFDRSLEFPLFPDDVQEAEQLLAKTGPGPLIAIHAGARAPARRWPIERFALLADELIERTGATVILTGGPDEIDQVRALERRMNFPPLNLAGKTSLGGLAAVIERMDLFVSNDTGPAHIARALNVPSLVIFGPADPVRWAPDSSSCQRIVRHSVACSPCQHWECPIDHRCLQLITPETVVDEAISILGSRSTLCAD